MVKRSPFTIVFAPETIEHLRAIESKHHGAIRDAIHEQLTYAPDMETRNRKHLDDPAPFDAVWELRLGPQDRFRVLYEIGFADQVVRILAVGEKRGNRLFVAGKEIET